jgi:hypothetical protein
MFVEQARLVGTEALYQGEPSEEGQSCRSLLRGIGRVIAWIRPDNSCPAT